MIRSCILASLLIATTHAAAQMTAAPPSSASLAMGTDIAAKVLPDGTYQRIMGGSMIKMMQGITSQTIATPIAPFLKAAGLPSADVSTFGKATLKQITDIIDPAYEQRMNAMMPVMMGEMGKVMTQFEPAMREGLAHAYAAHFTPSQLGDIDRFLNTPSGRAYAAESMTISGDPVVMEKMEAFMPTLMQALPGIMQKAMAATAGLPKPKTFATLDEADRAKLIQLVGVPSTKAGVMPAPPSAPMTPMTMTPDHAVRPIGDIAQYFSADHYPPEAIRAESQGRVVAAISVSPAGKPVSCAIETSSGSGVLDAETCRIAVDQIAYAPATDHRGRATAGMFRLPVRWVLPKDVPVIVGDTPSAAAPVR